MHHAHFNVRINFVFKIYLLNLQSVEYISINYSTFENY